MDSADEFLNSTSAIPDFIGDAAPAPTAVPGLPPPIDPMKPWRSIDVEAYLPLVKWIVKQPFSYAAKKFDEPLWETDDEEVSSLPLEEVTQKCLYDLRISRFADNPYVAFIVAAGTLAGVKAMAIKVSQELKRLAERERQQSGNDSAMRPSNDGQTERLELVRQPSPERPRRRPNPPATSQASQTGSGRTRESEEESSSSDSPTQVSRGSYVIESEPLDE